jgi:hypothetical protein
MPDIVKLRECDLSTIDMRTLGPEEWAVVKREVVRRAYAERTKVLRHLIGWLRSRWSARSNYADGPARAVRPTLARGGLAAMD